MAVSNVVTTLPRLAKKSAIVPSGSRSAGLLGLAGAALALAAFFDLALAWYPIGIGNPEWEFGTVSATLNSLPLTTVGLVLALVSALENGYVIRTRVLSSLFLTLALLVLASAVLYALDVPLALRAVQDPLARMGLTKAIIKAFGLVVVYLVGFTWIAIASWRRTITR